MSLEYAILGFLADKPCTGYDLKTRCFDATLDGLWPADQAQIYRTLERLRRARLIQSRRRRTSGRPDRLVFELTPEGRWALDEWASTPTHPPITRDPLHLQLYFGAATPDGPLSESLQARRALHQSRLDRLREHSRTVSSAAGPSRAGVLRQTAFDGAIAVERATIDWIDDCLDALKQGAVPGSSDGIGQRHLFGSEPA